MALSPAEKQKRYRDRKRAATKGPGDASVAAQAVPFFQFYVEDGNTDGVVIPLRLAGIKPPEFLNDQPAQFPHDLAGVDLPAASNSIARAELTIECLLDAAGALAGIVHRYKQSEIKARIAEIEQADLSDPIAKKQALADIVRLQKMLDQLSKQVRWTFPQWKVAGD
ncbi:hypothetical protein ASG72_02105 [Bosea sp. Leaf344]|uniref:hypothetical protein n=1 Tax=Bosea sp. Leaf344 TaxID=1736346 RepID=UPI0006F461F6|nr:hypothetical protein [Bosea sp. Leaf344]KQU54455.1 hypothetical protein ASG72_02105 [Bosea sp. Leaf344]